MLSITFSKSLKTLIKTTRNLSKNVCNTPIYMDYQATTPVDKKE